MKWRRRAGVASPHGRDLGLVRVQNSKRWGYPQRALLHQSRDSSTFMAILYHLVLPLIR
jgi:hypothetical protein